MTTHEGLTTESAFRADYIARTLTSVRVGLVLGAVLYALFAPLDLWMLPESWRTAHLIRFVLVLPVFAMTFASTFAGSVRRHLQAIVCTCAIVAGLGIVGMIAAARESEPGFRYYYAGLLLVLTWIFTLARLRFLPTAICSSTIILAYGYVAVFHQGLVSEGLLQGSGPVFLNNSFFLLAACIITLMGSFVLEDYARKDYRQREELSLALEELKAAESQLIQSERSSAIGHVVAGLVHELNTPLGAISSAADVVNRCARKLGAEGEGEPEKRSKAITLIGESASILRDATARVTQTLDLLKRFSNLDRADTADHDVNEALEDCVTLLAREIGEDIVVERHLGEVPKIRCRPNEIHQLFMSLLKNAVEAIPHAGKIVLRTSVRNGHVCVDVIDTGVGIPEHQLKDLFVPKLSRDRSRVKLSLGLATSHDVVRRHGGTIHVESRVGRGTHVSMSLPIRPGGGEKGV